MVLRPLAISKNCSAFDTEAVPAVAWSRLSVSDGFALGVAAVEDS
jgi:hypothetical protein